MNDWSKLLQLGVAGAIAVFLVWKMAGGFDTFAVRMEALEATVQADHAKIAVHSDRMEDLTGRAYMLNEKILRVLEIMCANDARTADARRICLEGR